MGVNWFSETEFDTLGSALRGSGLVWLEMANSRAKYARVRLDHARPPRVVLGPSPMLREIGRLRTNVDLAFLILRELAPLKRHTYCAFNRVSIVCQNMEILLSIRTSDDEVHPNPPVADKGVGVKAKPRTSNAEGGPMLGLRLCRPNLAFPAAKKFHKSSPELKLGLFRVAEVLGFDTLSRLGDLSAPIVRFDTILNFGAG